MKRIFLSLILTLCLSCCFAGQHVIAFSNSGKTTEEVTEDIERKMIVNNWEIVSITTVCSRKDRFVDAGLTTSIIVVFKDKD